MEQQTLIDGQTLLIDFTVQFNNNLEVQNIDSIGSLILKLDSIDEVMSCSGDTSKYPKTGRYLIATPDFNLPAESGTLKLYSLNPNLEEIGHISFSNDPTDEIDNSVFRCWGLLEERSFSGALNLECSKLRLYTSDIFNHLPKPALSLLNV